MAYHTCSLISWPAGKTTLTLQHLLKNQLFYRWDICKTADFKNKVFEYLNSSLNIERIIASLIFHIQWYICVSDTLATIVNHQLNQLPSSSVRTELVFHAFIHTHHKGTSSGPGDIAGIYCDPKWLVQIISVGYQDQPLNIAYRAKQLHTHTNARMQARTQHTVDGWVTTKECHPCYE